MIEPVFLTKDRYLTELLRSYLFPGSDIIPISL